MRYPIHFSEEKFLIVSKPLKPELQYDLSELTLLANRSGLILHGYRDGLHVYPSRARLMDAFKADLKRNGYACAEWSDSIQ